MKRIMHWLVLLLVIGGVVFAAVGCKKLSAEDLETQALARQFMDAVYFKRDPALAMTFVSPVTKYGYVTREMVEDIIATDDKDKCVPQLGSLEVGPLNIDMKIPELLASDTAKGVTARVGWKVSTTAKCAGQPDDIRVAMVELEKVNGKWGISRVTWQTGMGGTYDGGLS